MGQLSSQRSHIRASSEAGFSLVEVMAVLLIVGMAAGAVVLALPPPEPSGREEARALVARFALASEESILAGVPTGVRLTLDGYSFMQREAGEWTELSAHAAFAPREWNERAIVTLIRNGAPITLETAEEEAASTFKGPEDEPPTPQIRFDPTGTLTPFLLRLDHPDGVYAIEGEAGGAISWLEGYGD